MPYTKQQLEQQYEKLPDSLKDALFGVGARREDSIGGVPIYRDAGGNQKAALAAARWIYARASASGFAGPGAIEQHDSKHNCKRSTNENIRDDIGHIIDIIYSFIFMTIMKTTVTAAPMIRYAIKS